MITKDTWPESWASVPAGTEVSEEVYDHFFNVLPLAAWRGGYFQSSEPYSHEPDSNGRFRAKYLTFTKRDGKYLYLGIQFYGEYPKEV